jgi:hypothetical protein
MQNIYLLFGECAVVLTLSNISGSFRMSGEKPCKEKLMNKKELMEAAKDKLIVEVLRETEDKERNRHMKRGTHS